MPSKYSAENEPHSPRHNYCTDVPSDTVYTLLGITLSFAIRRCSSQYCQNIIRSDDNTAYKNVRKTSYRVCRTLNAFFTKSTFPLLIPFLEVVTTTVET